MDSLGYNRVSCMWILWAPETSLWTGVVSKGIQDQHEPSIVLLLSESKAMYNNNSSSNNNNNGDDDDNNNNNN